MTQDDRANVEIHVEDLDMTTCIRAPASITMGELARALVSQLRLDGRYRVLELDFNGSRVPLGGDEALHELLARSGEVRLFLMKDEVASAP